MRIFTFFTYVCLVPSFLLGALPSPDNFGHTEEEQVDLLIKGATLTLDKLQTLKSTLDAFRTQEKICVDDPDNNDKLFLLSQKALELRRILNQSHLNEYFRPSFLEEITKLSRQAENPKLPSMNKDLIQ